MTIGMYGILVIFGLFIILLIVNPNLSCFGKRVKSPFYPILRKKNLRRRSSGHGLHSAERSKPGEADGGGGKDATKKTQDYGFKLD